MINDTQITRVNGVYRPVYNWGGHIVGTALILIACHINSYYIILLVIHIRIFRYLLICVILILVSNNIAFMIILQHSMNYYF